MDGLLLEDYGKPDYFERDSAEQALKALRRDKEISKEERAKYDWFYKLPRTKKYPEDFSVMDIRIGRITRVKHNTADVRAYTRSYVLSVDVGFERGPRQIISELGRFYTRKQLLLKPVVVFCNVVREKIFGDYSYAWLLAAQTADGDLELLNPPPEAYDIDQVTVFGYPAIRLIREQPYFSTKKAKKLMKDMTINSEGIAMYKDLPLDIENKPGTHITAGRYARNCPIQDAVVKKYKKKKPIDTTDNINKQNQAQT